MAASEHGQHETVRTLVELGAGKEAKDDVRNLMIMMIISISLATTTMI